MTSVAVFFDTDDGRLLLPVSDIYTSGYRLFLSTHIVSYSKVNRQHKHFMLTIMRIPPSLSLVVTRKAEHRNSDEDGQGNVRGDNGNYRPNAY